MMNKGSVALVSVFMFSMGFFIAPAASAGVSVTPITWDVVGLSHNRPLTQGPELFPVAARVCNESGADIEDPVEVDFIWEDGQDPFFGDALADDFINLREGSLEQIVIPGLDDGDCVDAYYEIRLTRSASAFGNSRAYRIEANTGVATFATPSFRQIYIEELIRQNRNEIVGLRFGQESDESDWVDILGGGTINLAVGETYFFEKTTATATGYEQLQSFISLSNTLFRILDVETEYGQMSFGAENRIPVPHSQLYGDGCIWDPDSQSPNYLSCTDTGKVGGTVTTVYQIEILTLPGAGEDLTLSTLIYDLSGGSYHYNTDFDDPTELRNINVFDPAQEAGFAKRFIPSTIAATVAGEDDQVTTLRFTISNPNPVEISGYNFVDDLPGDMEVASDPNASSTCGGSITANPGSGVVEFDGGAIAAKGSCIVLVNVIVPFDAGETYPLLFDNEVDLFVGDAVDPAATAEATLEVTEDPPPPQECTSFTDDNVARWNNFTGADPIHPAESGEKSATAITDAGDGLDTEVTGGDWRSFLRSNDQGVQDPLGNARTEGFYYLFEIDTTGIDSLELSFRTDIQNNNSPRRITLDHGPPGEITQTDQPSWDINNEVMIHTASEVDLDNLNPEGITQFFFYVYSSGGGGQNWLAILDIEFSGTGEVCSPIDPEDAPDAPELAKSFNPDPVRVGEISTLTFDLTNPNADDDLTGVTFRDELPAGMEAIGGFVNGCGGTWGLEGGDPGILLFEDGELDAGTSCSLVVQVQSTTTGPNVNISDPINATETLPGNTAIATLEVLPPPLPPSIVKQFDPDPLLVAEGETTGQTTLRFLITDTNSDMAIDNVSFIDELPANMAPVDDPLMFSNNGLCGAPTLVWNVLDNELAFSGGTIVDGETCMVELEVEVINLDFSAGEMEFTNQTGPVSHIFNGIVYEGNDATATLVVDNPIPEIRIRKQVGPGGDPNNDPIDEWPWSDYLAVIEGDEIFYLFIIENIGEVELTDIQIDDPNLAIDLNNDCDWPVDVGELALADVDGNHLAFCVVGPETAGNSLLTNTAEVTADADGVPVSDIDSATYAPINLSIAKSVDPESYYFEGQQLDYTFVVTNDGPAQLVEIFNINDALPGLGPITCENYVDVGNNNNVLDPAESVVCIADYLVQSGDLNAGGQIDNSATASVSSYESDESDATANLEAVEIFKSASPEPFMVGQPASYGITVINLGSIATSDPIVVEDSLPAGVSLSSFSGTDWNCLDNNGDLTCTFSGVLAPFGDAGDETTVTLNIDVDSAAEGLGGGNNTATITAGDPGCEAATPPARCSDTVEVDVESTSADLAVVKNLTTAGPYTVGQTVSYTITVTNNGPSDATGVEVNDVPDNLTITSVSGGGCGSFPCTLGDLAEGASVVITVEATIDADGDFGNLATVSGNEDDPVPGNNSDEEGGSTTPSADIAVSKVLTTSGPHTVGDTVSFDIVVSNLGPSEATNVQVTDTPTNLVNLTITNAGGATCPGDAFPCTMASLASGNNFTITVAGEIDEEGAFANEASASADEDDPDLTNNTDEDGGSTTPSADIAVSKSAVPASGETVTAGQLIDYTLTVVVSDSDTTDEVILTDTLGAGLTLDAGSLPDECSALGQEVTCTLGSGAVPDTYQFSYSASVDADATGSVGNNVVATGVDDPVCGTCDTDHPVADASVTVNKIADPVNGTEVSPGQTLIYTLTVTVSDAATTAAVVLTDTLGAGLTVDTVPAECAVAGQEITCTLASGAEPDVHTFVYTATVDTDATVSVGNRVEITEGGGDPDPTCTTCETDHPVVDALLSVTKVLTNAPDPIEVGSVLTYTVTATNSGNVTLNNVTVSDDLIDPSSVVCATLEVDEDCVLTGTYTVIQDDVDAGEIVNTGTAESEETDPVEDTVTTPIPGLSIIEATSVCVNDAPYLDYELSASGTTDPTVTVRWIANDGSGDVLDEESDLELSGRLLWVEAAVDDSGNGTAWPGWDRDGEGNWVEVPTQARPTVMVEFEVNPSVATVVNYPDATPDCRVDPSQPVLELDKSLTSAPDPIVQGSELTYTIIATNAGNVTLFDVVIEDDMISPDTVQCDELLPGEQCVLVGTYTVTEADVMADEIVNIATANGQDSVGNPVPEQADSEVTVLSMSAPIPVPVLHWFGWLIMLVGIMLGGLRAARHRSRFEKH
jgi:uncharacterized repeat protein (TIGR01451 family)/fimbrial isopeptide formation D2 family protein